jgi:hypothetical protein
VAITAEELARFLNITLSEDDSRRPELEACLQSAVALTEARTGPIYTREVSYRIRSEGRLLVVPAVDLAAVTAVVGPGGEVPLADFRPGYLDLANGLIYLPVGSPAGPYVVTVTAGTDTPPEDLRRAVLYVAGHLWDSQRGRSARPGVLGEERTGQAGTPAWAIPYVAQSLMEPNLLPLDARRA